MSKPATKISTREQIAQEIRKQNMAAIIRDIEKDLQIEKSPQEEYHSLSG
jgi:hypothetical protein